MIQANNGGEVKRGSYLWCFEGRHDCVIDSIDHTCNLPCTKGYALKKWYKSNVSTFSTLLNCCLQREVSYWHSLFNNFKMRNSGQCAQYVTSKISYTIATLQADGLTLPRTGSLELTWINMWGKFPTGNSPVNIFLWFMICEKLHVCGWAALILITLHICEVPT